MWLVIHGMVWLYMYNASECCNFLSCSTSCGRKEEEQTVLPLPRLVSLAQLNVVYFMDSVHMTSSSNGENISISVVVKFSMPGQSCWGAMWPTDKELCQVSIHWGWKPVILTDVWETARYVQYHHWKKNPVVNFIIYMAFILLKWSKLKLCHCCPTT